MPSLISQMQSAVMPQQMQTQAPMQPQNNAFMQSLRSTMNFIQNSRNPQMMLQNMMMQNPQLKQAMSLVQSFGGNPQQAFLNLARQQGVNPSDVLNALRVNKM